MHCDLGYGVTPLASGDLVAVVTLDAYLHCPATSLLARQALVNWFILKFLLSGGGSGGLRRLNGKFVIGAITTSRLKVIQSEWKEGGNGDRTYVSRLLGTLSSCRF